MHRFVFLASAPIVLASCGLLIGLEHGEPRIEDAGTDAAEGGVQYSDVTDPNKWTTFDLQSIVGTSAAGFIGGTFDGRYVYFSPGANGMYVDRVVRYDTTASFGLSGAWQMFPLSQLNPNAMGYYGATVAGKSVAFAPFGTTLAAFYDTQKNFDAGFSLKTPPISGEIGATFDGRFLYYAPHYFGMAYHGTALRYALDAGADASPWSTFDIPSKIGMGATGFFGSVFDGRFIYYAPYISPFVVRYNTSMAFGDPMAWQGFDLRTLRTDAINYTTAAFDGQYVYLIPRGGMTLHGLVARFDTGRPIDDKNAWQIFDMTQISPAAKGYSSAAFDGRYLYFVPASTGLVIRYDTTAAFGALQSWTAFDVSTKAAAARGFNGAVFDGQFVYLVPHSGSIVARFDARTPAQSPLFYNGGSFF